MTKYLWPVLVLFSLCPVISSALERATNIHEVELYVSPGTSAAKLGTVDRGRELSVVDSTTGWVQVQADMGKGRTLSGWVESKYVVKTSTPDGERIVFGEAVDSEDQASQRHGRRGAAQDAMRLYQQAGEMFPASLLAGEAAYRAADIRWQLDKSDVMARPSAHQADPDLREGMDEERMKQVMKKFPDTKWADLAAYNLIDNKLCGEWQNTSRCPEKESEIYFKYASERPQSPKAAEALYNAAYRQSALIEIYRTEQQAKKSEMARGKATQYAQQVASKYPQTDWASRAQLLLFKMQGGIPTYGVEAEASSGGPQP